MKLKQDYLKHYFGYDSFRRGQDELIDATLGGRDTLGIMPTGGGKSICYQIPALMFNGLTVVISPLISLMKDQVMALKKAGINAEYINSQLTVFEHNMVVDALRAGMVKILYVAPERLELEGFFALLSNLEISFVAVDEAHCISQWGQDFRPSYLKIVDFIESLPVRPPVAAYTATATEKVRLDICEKLRLRSPLKLVTGFDRPNLNFDVRMPSSKLSALVEYISEHGNLSGIVYCSTRRLVENVCNKLKAKGIPATRYHAGLDPEERRRNQEDFIYDRTPVMVATNAFGMGIDKSNVSYVIHYNMPKSLEEYYQEAGRAGRDGSYADCILLFSNSDIITAKNFIFNPINKDQLEEGEYEELLRKNFGLLDKMVAYCKSTKCLRGHILSYFGQEHDERCENCGNCHSVFVEEDVTENAQKILSCIKRASTHLGYSVGRTLIAKILIGSCDKRLLSLGLNNITTYGIMKNTSEERVNNLIARLVDLDMVRVDQEFGGTSITPNAYPVLFGDERLVMSFKEPPPSIKGRKKIREKLFEASSYDAALFDSLRALRYEIACEEQVPAYIVFSNATLHDMVLKKPRNRREFRGVVGIGRVKATKYADRFVEKIREFGKSVENKKTEN